jgi:hypothetical protein
VTEKAIAPRLLSKGGAMPFGCGLRKYQMPATRCRQIGGALPEGANLAVPPETRASDAVGEGTIGGLWLM